MNTPRGESEQLKLSQAATTLVDECRMVLPGVQAIFGFQLMVVFQQKFGEQLDKPYQCLHLAALVLVAIAAAVIMAPAAYHRMQGARHVTERFIRVSSRLLLIALGPLALGLSLDVFLLGKLVLGNDGIAVVLAGFVFAVMVFMWYVFPRAARHATPC
jgi:Protein of unknown function (DUF2889).